PAGRRRVGSCRLVTFRSGDRFYQIVAVAEIWRISRGTSMRQFDWRTFSTAVAGLSLFVMGTATGGERPTPRTAAKAGFARGIVLASDGKPINAPGAKVTLAIHGISNLSGERVEYTPPVRPDGTYEQKLTDGSFRFFAAQIQVPFGDKTFRIPLAPIGDDKSNR